MIDEKLLYEFGAEVKFFTKGDYVFEEGNIPFFYYQLKSGKIKLNNFKEDGKEFIQNIFSNGQSFGESILFIDVQYPMNAICLEYSYILQLPKSNFYKLLDNRPEVSIELNKALSQRLYYKYVMLQNLSSSDPATRMMTLMNYLKSFQVKKEKFSFVVPFTRQQVANLTGLCVETVIRTSKKMAKNDIIRIKDRKIHY